MSSMLIVGRHLPYGWQPRPELYGPGDDPEKFIWQEARTGDASLFPLSMTVQEYATAFWRVRSWRLSGQVGINIEVNDDFQQTWIAAQRPFEVIFNRVAENIANPEKILLLQSENLYQSSSIFLASGGSVTIDGIYEYNDPLTEERVEEPFIATMQCALSSNRGFPFRSIGKQPDGNDLSVGFQCELFMADVGGAAYRLIASYNQEVDFEDSPYENVEAASVELSGKCFSDKMEVKLYGVDIYGFVTSNGITLSDMKLEPHKWFPWPVDGKPIFDEDTGELIKTS